MNKNRIIMAVLAMSLLGTQPMVAADQPQASPTAMPGAAKSGIVNRAKKEYQEFRDALKCVKQQGFRKCSRAQKKRIIIAGVAVITFIAATTAAATYGGTRWWRRKKAMDLSQAVFENDIDLVKRLIGEGVNARYAATLLYEAAKNRNDDMVELLVSKGADLNRALYYATVNDNTDVVRLLIEKGVGVSDIRNDTTPLHIAIARGNTELARLLIEEGSADVSVRDRANKSPLIRAVNRGFIDSVELLIEKGADVNAKAYWGGTPLHLAAERGKRDIAVLLIQRGADLFIKNKDGKTPLDLVKDESFKQKLLWEWRRRRGIIRQSIRKATSPETELSDPTQRRVPELPHDMIREIIKHAYPSDK